jgi:hypothetical protein
VDWDVIWNCVLKQCESGYRRKPIISYCIYCNRKCIAISEGNCLIDRATTRFVRAFSLPFGVKMGLQTYIRGVCCSNLDQFTGHYNWRFRYVCSVTPQNLLVIPTFAKDAVLPDLYQFTIHKLPYSSNPCRLLTAVPVAQTFRHQPLKAEAWVQSHASACGIRGGEIFGVTGFSLSASLFPCQYHYICISVV